MIKTPSYYYEVIKASIVSATMTEQSYVHKDDIQKVSFLSSHELAGQLTWYQNACAHLRAS